MTLSFLFEKKKKTIFKIFIIAICYALKANKLLFIILFLHIYK